MPRKPTLGQSAASFASRSQSQLSALRRELKNMQSSLAVAHAAIRVPVIKQLRGKIPKSTSGGISGFTELAASLIGKSLGGELTDKGSSSQLAGQLFDAVLRGQRTR